MLEILLFIIILCALYYIMKLFKRVGIVLTHAIDQFLDMIPRKTHKHNNQELKEEVTKLSEKLQNLKGEPNENEYKAQLQREIENLIGRP